MSTQEPRTTPPPEADFDPHRLRTITDMKRSKDDRLLGGVCSGAAKYLDIDPVIVRVVIAVLTVIGLAGLILYVAAWFLIPAEGEDKSIAADWFKLDKNEEQVRIAGLVIAAVLAAASVIGDNGWFWGGGPWILVPLALLYYLFVVRPRRRRLLSTPGAGPVTPQVGPAVPAAPTGPTKPPRQRSWALTVLTVSLAAIAVAATRIYAELHDGLPWTVYVAVALAVVAVGLLISTLFGHGGPLIAVGVVLAVILATGSFLPNGKLGQQRPTPMTASQVQTHYNHGVGLLELDLTRVSDPDNLLGETVKLRSGVGQIKVIVPTGLNVEVDSSLGAGEISVFDRKVNGTDNELDLPATGPALTIDIHQRLGNIEVIRR